jgi:hypothetical protein
VSTVTTINLDAADVRRDIDGRLFDLNRRHASALGITPAAHLSSIIERAQQLATRLTGAEGHTAGRNTAEGLLGLLILQAEQRERTFWETPLGQAIAWWTGGQGSVARRRMIAEAVTGTSRQHISRLITDERLTLGPDGDVTAESLRAYLQARYPREVTA